MKQNTHPKYVETKITCGSCGSVVETRATKENIVTEVCSQCHPFFTGQHKLIDAEGRVERFMNRYKNFKKKT